MQSGLVTARTLFYFYRWSDSEKLWYTIGYEIITVILTVL